MSAEFGLGGSPVARAEPGWSDTLLKHASRVALGLAAFACFWLFVLPVVVVALSSVATRWSGTILPSGYSLRWFERLGQPEFDALATSLEIGFGVAVIGTVLGLWLALALEGRARGRLGALVDALVMLPNGVPSVVLGLAVLIAYHQKPVDLSSSAAIVVLVQLALILPFCYRCAAAALRPELTILREAAASLGAPPSMVLRRVLLPQLVPALRASLALGFALSLGELGATMTVYPPGFATVPIVVIGQVERGYYLPASALSLLMLVASLAALMLIAARVPRLRRQ
ncbi:2-aminoethylphosphonate ABC transport system, membrane component PhnV [Burkholderia gladioli]|jgi:2-aminoethylphosphonate transport system permease protein|uniref:2-aminoethylphosphonate ABC transport system, membrane component PhnV n=1 Tax=Burkholderia gladioli TaxID=28095 RepID=A0AAW3F350_BURGA|nr:2-aminoethylphosphonate ABC transport system, membrane component PhnV [Burkholderia gladioli]AJW94981.1 2-aminoethylphosphonate ABC transport system, membrane component PhnV [Burkholderia gladioli]ASD82943.1 2-aminoethylphosphonate ABC transport system, membrane component PhnV [Burkholderia gladioli pv. gladioli]AWY50378.1 2-aminoethylphosphonate ABC transport system, membrane component PhnV [Burkholderia gladioli pv. gladioli]KGC14255.1 2-aminoethylphosphonate ABC transport system, membrane